MAIHIYQKINPDSDFVLDYMTTPEITISDFQESTIHFDFVLHTLSLGYEQVIRTVSKQYSIKRPLEYINIRKSAHKTEPFVISTMCEADYQNNELLLNEYTASKMALDEHIAMIIYKAINGDVLLYIDSYPTVISNVGEVKNVHESPEDVVKSVFGEDDYNKFVKERYKDRYINNQFFTRMCSFATPVGSYLDLEADFLMSFAKFLYEKSDPDFIEFLGDNSKYKKILERSIETGSNTVENKELSSIERSFNRKKIIQDQIKDYKDQIAAVDSAQNVEDLQPMKLIFNVE